VSAPVCLFRCGQLVARLRGRNAGTDHRGPRRRYFEEDGDDDYYWYLQITRGGLPRQTFDHCNWIDAEWGLSAAVVRKRLLP
jgi:hypothetical protein